MTEVTPLLDTPDLLGEGPIWDPQEGVLWRVDIEGAAVHRLDPATGASQVWTTPSNVGCLALRASGGLVLALVDGFHAFDPASGAVTPITNPEPPSDEIGFNDGAVDAAGRFYCGSLDRITETKPIGSLWRLDPDGSTHRLIEGCICPNGIDWSLDDRTMYYTDSGKGTITTYDVGADGDIANPRVFATVAGPAVPDGLTIDADGFVWSPEWDGSRIVRYAPDGSIDRIVELPVSRPTAIAFGGPDLDVLYLTSARSGLSAAQLAAEPLAGQTFAIDAGVRGRPPHRYGG